MASLDGHSLNVKIDRIHKETQEELAKMKDRKELIESVL